MPELLKLFPRGGSIQRLESGSYLIHYWTDGAVVVHPDGFVSGDHYALKKLAFVFGRQEVPFVTVGNGLLVNPDPSWSIC